MTSLREHVPGWLALALLVGGGCGSSGPEGSTPAEPTADPTAGAETVPGEGASAPTGRLRFSEALAAAQPRYPDSPPVEVEVETEDGKELLEVEFLVDGEIQEVYLDPVTGAFVKEETEELSEAERATLPKLAETLAAGEITLSKAIELALARYDESLVREIELEVHGDEVILEVEVEDDGGEVVEWVLDPRSGEVRGRETDDETHAVEPVT